MKRFFGHFKTILKHKWIVLCLSIRAGIPFRGLMHDFSKFSPVEFFEGVRYYQGNRSPITKCREVTGYSKAGVHHYHMNKHHANYWYDVDSPVKMPIFPKKYIFEMICDDLAAGITYNGKHWKPSTQLEYFLNKKDRILLHDKIKEMLIATFTEVSEKGLKQTITKKNLNRLYEQYIGNEELSYSL